jgi:hypothetical protein
MHGFIHTWANVAVAVLQQQRRVVETKIDFDPADNRNVILKERT